MFHAVGISKIAITGQGPSQAFESGRLAMYYNRRLKVKTILRPALLLAQESIRRVEDFPAFVLVDNKGNDFFRQLA
uniref:fumarate hydratase C-terminal domain-containing protein n=1 Tax=Candidatus Electronema sp. TaxID=2698783 RepID=UPI00405787E1